MERLARALPDPLELPVVVALAFGGSILTGLISIWIPLPPYVVDDAVLANAVSSDLLLLAAIGLLLALRGWRPSQFGLVRPRWSDLASGLGLFVLSWSAMMAVHLVLNRMVPTADWSSPITGFTSGAALTLLFFALNSLIEEIFVNGYVLARLGHRGRALSIAVSTAIRVSYHLYQSPGAALTLVPMGLLYADWTRRRASLWPALFAHTLHNMLFYAIMTSVTAAR